MISSIAIFIGILIAINIPAPFLGLEFERDTPRRLWYQPPGYVIPIAWFILFILLGIARHLILKTEFTELQFWIFALAILCASYAYYTLGLAKITSVSALWFGLWGNLGVIIFASITAYKLWPISQHSAYLILPVIIWTTYATLIVLGEINSQKL